jgi:hypothetical protein
MIGRVSGQTHAGREPELAQVSRGSMGLARDSRGRGELAAQEWQCRVTAWGGHAHNQTQKECDRSGELEMAKLALIYGMRLLPEEDLGELGDATVTLKNGKTARVTMHLIEGSKEEIEKTFHQSVEAFFEMYPEI